MTSVCCTAFNCGNKQGQDGVTFHRFPLEKSNIISKWLTAMRKPKWIPTKSNFLCSQHFTDDMFVEKDGYRFLRYDAVPTKFHVTAQPKALFPTEWTTRLLTVKDLENDTVKGFVAEARIAIRNKDQFSEWLKLHETLSKANYKLLRTYPNAGKNLTFKSEYGCRYISEKSSFDSESGCPAKLLVRIRSVNNKFRPNDDAMQNYPCTVVLYHLHNHSIGSNVPDIVNAVPNDVSEEVKQKFIEMFKGAYFPELALSTHQSDLLEEYIDEYDEILSDRYVCPNLEWLEKFHSTFITEFGEWNDEKVLSVLEKEISKINADKGRAKMQTVGDNVVVALCTPLMQRVHSLKSAGEIVFLDSSGLMDRCKCYVYVLMAYSCAEGLPLGLLITTSDSENVVTSGLQLLAEILPEKAFGQYGKQGPEVFLTANNDDEQNSVKIVFPESTILLCSFTLLHALWRWLWDGENNIEEFDRCTLFSLTHKIMKTKSADEFTECFSSTMQNETVAKYENFQKYFKELSDMSSKWAVCFKNEIVDKDKEISAVEMASHVLKDKLYITKAYNISQLVGFLANDLESYYKEKIIHCINNTLEKFLQSSYKPEMRIVDDLAANLLPLGQYQVLHSKNGRSYFVDMDIYVCSCPLGTVGARCKHKYAVSVTKKLDLTSVVPNDETIKKELYWIATNSLNNLFGSMEPYISETETLTLDAGDDEDYDPQQDRDRPGSKWTKPKINKKSTPSPKEEAKTILNKVVKDIMEKYDSNPTEFHKAVITAAVNYQNLNNESEILAALRNFATGV